MTGRGGRARAGVVALAVLLVLAGVVALVAYERRDKGTPYVPPRAGQASILLTAGQAGSGLDLNTIRADDGMAFAPDGSLYVLRTDLFKVSPDRKVSRVWRAGAYATGGLTVLPDGTVAVGVRGGVLRITAHGKASTLAGSPDPAPGKKKKGKSGKGGKGGDGAGTGTGGTSGTGDTSGTGGIGGTGGTGGSSGAKGATGPAGSTDATGSTLPAGSTAFVGVARPLGTRPDGALLVQDFTAVYAVEDGTATKVLDTPVASEYLNTDADTDAVRPTADAAGDVYFVAAADHVAGLAHRITRVTPSGGSAPVPIPKRIPGLAGDPDQLTVRSLAGDGGDGVYVDAVGGSGSTGGLDDYIVHLYDGKARVVGHSHTAAHVLDCTLPHAVSALELPCSLPTGMAYRDGRLALDGMVHYTLEVAVS